MDKVFLKELGEDDLSSIQKVFEACEDYFILTTSNPVTSASAHSLYIQLPDGKSYEDKHIFGICDFSSPDLIGVIDAILGYPEKDTLTLGLFLVIPEYQREAGNEAYNLLEQWVKKQGVSKIRISVYEVAKDDVKFWKQAGFRLTDQMLQDGISKVIVFEKSLF